MTKMLNRSLLFILTIIATPALAAATGAAAPIQSDDDKKAPLKVTSDRMVSDKQKQIITFFGSVKAVKGKLTVFSDEMIVNTTEDQSDFTSIIAVGSVRILRGDKVATGEKAVYLADKKLIKISGSPTLTEGKNRATGDKVIYYFDTEDMEIFGSKKARSTLIIFPNDKKDDGKPEEIAAQERTDVTFGSGDEALAEAPKVAKPVEPVIVDEAPKVAEPVEPVIVDEAPKVAEPVDSATEVKTGPVEDVTDSIDITTSATVALDESSKTEISWYTVQLGAYEEQREASRMLIRLKRGGYRAYFAPSRKDGKTLYRVRVGKYSKLEFAQIMADELRQQEELKAVILPYSLSD